MNVFLIIIGSKCCFAHWNLRIIIIIMHKQREDEHWKWRVKSSKCNYDEGDVWFIYWDVSEYVYAYLFYHGFGFEEEILEFSCIEHRCLSLFIAIPEIADCKSTNTTANSIRSESTTHKSSCLCCCTASSIVIKLSWEGRRTIIAFHERAIQSFIPFSGVHLFLYWRIDLRFLVMFEEIWESERVRELTWLAFLNRLLIRTTQTKAEFLPENPFRSKKKKQSINQSIKHSYQQKQLNGIWFLLSQTKSKIVSQLISQFIHQKSILCSIKLNSERKSQID